MGIAIWVHISVSGLCSHPKPFLYPRFLKFIFPYLVALSFKNHVAINFRTKLFAFEEKLIENQTIFIFPSSIYYMKHNTQVN